jgi:hypothetical protein
VTVNAQHRFEGRFARQHRPIADKAAQRSFLDVARQRFAFCDGARR